MSKKHFFLLLLSVAILCGGCSTLHRLRDGSYAVRVTDAHFRQYLLDNGYAAPLRRQYMKATRSGLAVQLIDCHAMDISSLDGIALFPNLKVLICSENDIGRLDLSHNRQLKQLVAIENPLRSLDISQCPELKVLQVSFHHLRKLDVSHNAKLEELLCIFAPNIRQLDLSGNPKLQTLYIRETNIRLVDLRLNPAFRNLHALDTPLEAIVVSPQHDLDSIGVSVEDGVQLYVLDAGAKLPKLSRQEPEKVLVKQEEERHPIVMTFEQADSLGLDVAQLREQYPAAFDYNDSTKVFSPQSVVQTLESYGQFLITYQLFLSGLGSEFKPNGVTYDTPFQIWKIAFHSADGYVDYFLYRVQGDNPFTPEMEARFRQALTQYFINTPNGFFAKRPYSQCGPLNFVPASATPQDSAAHGTAPND